MANEVDVRMCASQGGLDGESDFRGGFPTSELSGQESNERTSTLFFFNIGIDDTFFGAMPLLKKVSGAAAAAAAASGAAVVLWGQRITVVVPLPSRPPPPFSASRVKNMLAGNRARPNPRTVCGPFGYECVN